MLARVKTFPKNNLPQPRLKTFRYPRCKHDGSSNFLQVMVFPFNNLILLWGIKTTISMDPFSSKSSPRIELKYYFPLSVRSTLIWVWNWFFYLSMKIFKNPFCLWFFLQWINPTNSSVVVYESDKPPSSD